jgi:tetratricopeptide (TPR) repeat protein
MHVQNHRFVTDSIKRMLTRAWIPVASAMAMLATSASASSPVQPVTCRELDEVIPTYLSGPPSPDPMFYFGSQSQGAEGRIYPYPLYNNLTNKKADQTYRLIYLENQYIKIAIAPQIGGRVLSAQDKTNGYYFVYNQHVIKPALIGLLGAWISGGIEWNVPHHHRASTFIPVQYLKQKNQDGSWTVWVGELEIRQRMCWAVGYTLRPGSSVLECSVRIINRTPLPQSMLCFANVAVHADQDYQIIFPPSTQFVAQHLKREFTTWPIATTRYGAVDWNNVDASWYKNHMTADSMFAWNKQDDFFAGYDHGKQAGTMSVADHHIVPGKKFFTWGNGAHGRMWDSILTDKDGPYLELMVGAYSDNQPDYSWMQPSETRSFKMSWYPFRDIDGVKMANLDAAVNLEVKDGVARFGFYSTTARSNARAVLTVAGRTISNDPISISPDMTYRKQLPLPAGTDEHDVRAALYDGDRELVSYSPIRLSPETMPVPVTPPAPPADVASDEELDLAGQRIMQFHDPLHDAKSYWEETLRRDPADTAANVDLGLAALQRAQYPEAEGFFRTALTRLTAKYTSPKDTEPLYYLGVALKAQGRQDEAFDAFYKAAWSQEWRAPAYFSLAEIACARGEFGAALDFIDRSLDANALDLRALGLKAAILRHLGRIDDALATIADGTSRVDPLDARLMAEDWLAGGTSTEDALKETLRSFPNAGLEVASEYWDAGLWSDGSLLLQLMVASSPDNGASQPLALYYLGDFAERQGQTGKAEQWRRAAAACPPDYVFPFQSELIRILRRATVANPRDARAPYYLGNLLFDWQPAEATTLWERSAYLDPSFPVVWRNLALSYSHSGGDVYQAKAIESLEKSVALSDAYPEHFFELDDLYAASGLPVARRLALFESHQAALANDDECLARIIALKTFVGKNDEAIELLQGHTFNIWEGGTQFDTGAMWTDALLARGRGNLSAGNAREALTDFEVALIYPPNLRATPWEGTGKRSIEVGYWVGLAHQALGDATRATRAWQDAASATLPRPFRRSEANASVDQNVQRYYQAMALAKLGQTDKAAQIFKEIAEAGETMSKTPVPDASLPPGMRISPRTHAADSDFVAGLGYLGLGELAKAHEEFHSALDQSPDYLPAKLALGEEGRSAAP